MFGSFIAYKEGRFAVGRTDYGVEIQSAIHDDGDYERLPDNMKAELDELLVTVRSSFLNLENLLK